MGRWWDSRFLFDMHPRAAYKAKLLVSENTQITDFTYIPSHVGLIQTKDAFSIFCF